PPRDAPRGRGASPCSRPFARVRKDRSPCSSSAAQTVRHNRTPVRRFTMTPKGRFELARSREFFGGWPSAPDDTETIVMGFPVGGWRASAAIAVRQERGGRLVGEGYGAGPGAGRAWRQARATVSLDVDVRRYPALGRRDAVIGELQRRYGLVRPTLFSSPYEAAAHFVLSHRRSIPH